MISISSTPLTAHSAHSLQTISSSTTSSQISPASLAEPAPVGVGFVSQDHPGDKSFAAQLLPPTPIKDYSHASLGAIAEGHYTEF
jgi:hypothetical protein